MPVSSELQHEGAGDLPNVTLSLTHTQTHIHTHSAEPSPAPGMWVPAPCSSELPQRPLGRTMGNRGYATIPDLTKMASSKDST